MPPRILSVSLSILFPLHLASAAVGADTRAVLANEMVNGSVVVVGRLLKPLGTPVEIECTVVEDGRLTLKNPLVGPEHQQLSMLYLLKVDRVGGKQLDAPIAMEFELLATGDVRVAPSRHEFDALARRLVTPGARERHDAATGFLVEADPISDDELEAFKRNYVGSRHKLIVYESARFEGTPKNIPEGYSFFVGGERAFGFSTYLVVLGEL